MKLPAISISQLMIIVFVSALLIVSAIKPEKYLTSAFVTMTMTIMATAALKAIVCHDKYHRLWAGFAVFSCSYVVLGVGPKFDAIDTPLLTTEILKELYFGVTGFDRAKTLSDAAMMQSYRSEILMFFQVGHSFFALLAGGLGAVFCKFLTRDG